MTIDSQGAPSGVLDGIHVLDLSRVLSGPSCGRVLLELGAEVIKVEPPDGDTTRRAFPKTGGHSVYFSQQNAGKRLVCIDLSSENGRALGLDLAAACDVVVENFRPGVADRLGLGYEQVRARNPRIVYCSITGYGQTGPAATRRAYAGVVHAEAGVTEFTSRKRTTPLTPEPLALGDTYTGLHGVIGVLGALFHAERFGEGQHVDVAMADTMLSVNEWTTSELAGGDDGEVQLFGGMKAVTVTLADGTVVITPGDPAINFKSWCRAFDRLDLMSDERFADKHVRDANRAELLALLAELAADVPDWDAFENQLSATPLAPGVVHDIAGASRTEWARHRGSFVDVPVGDEAIVVPQHPVRFSAFDPPQRSGPGHAGSDNRAVLAEVLGFGDAELDRLTAEGVLVESS